MAKYFKDKNIVRVVPDSAANIMDKLPPGNYHLRFAPFQGFFLEESKDFILPDKIYGDADTTASKVMKTYEAKKTNTGVLLSGEKGAGKTMTAKLICQKAYEENIPTIIIDKIFEADFCRFITDIDQKCVVLFDEFEKIFNRDDGKQERMLSILDGTHASNKLFLLTVNEAYHVNSYLMNRPGRIHYHLKYEGLRPHFVKEYCEDTLENKSWIPSVISLCKLIPKFNFDMLQAIVFECNTHDEDPKTAYKMLNMDVSNSHDKYEFEAISSYKDKDYKFTGTVGARIFQDHIYFADNSDEEYDEEYDDGFSRAISTSKENLVSVKDGAYYFKDKSVKITLKQKTSQNFHLDF